jgi:putative ABC transport system substrate-binding protein
MAAKWLQIAPNVKRAGMFFNPDTAPLGGLYYLPPFQEAVRTFEVFGIGLDPFQIASCPANVDPQVLLRNPTKLRKALGKRKRA